MDVWKKLREIEDRLQYIERAERASGYPYLVAVYTTPYTPPIVPLIIEVDPDSLGADITIALPPAGSCVIDAGPASAYYSGDYTDGLYGTVVYTIINVRGAHNVIVDGSGGETINGNLTATLANQWDSITIYSDGLNWKIIAQTP